MADAFGLIPALLSAAEAAPLAKINRLPTLSDSFRQQWEYETSAAMFNAVTCSRRSGKTTGAVRRHVRKLATAPAGSWTHFGSLIRRNARKHFWRPLLAMLDSLGWEYRPNNTEMILELSNGNWCQAFGCDDMSGIKAVQGDGSVLFSIDECHLPNDDVLEALVDVATPMLTDRGGLLDLLGLPPEVEGGFFSRSLDSGGFKVFSWTMFDHDFPRSREEKLADVIERCRHRGLPVEITDLPAVGGRPVFTCGPGTHPLVARQYFGKRVSDPEKLAYEYSPARNDYDPASIDVNPLMFDNLRSPWRFALGLDLGFQDCDAIVVVAWNKEDADRKLYVVHDWAANHQDVDQLSAVLAEVLKKFKITMLVGDHGGHGAVKVLETLKNRMRLMFQPKPADVMVSVGLVNDDLRTGRLMVPKGGEIGKDLLRVQRRVTAEHKVEINKKGFHSDRSEALRYAHHAARHWAAKAPKPIETIDQRRDRAYAMERKKMATQW